MSLQNHLRAPHFVTLPSFAIHGLQGILFVVILLLTTETSAQYSPSADSCSGVFSITEVSKEPGFIGGMPALYEYLRENLNYPDTAYEDGIQGKVYVSFVVDHTGLIRDVSVIRGVNRSLDLEAARVVAKMPKWDPGMKECGAVDCRYNLPVSFTIHTSANDTTQGGQLEPVGPVFGFLDVESFPSFPGGANKLKQWMKANLHYPDSARAAQIEGSVMVGFVVEIDGSRSGLKVTSPSPSILASEALRLVAAMPPWEPGLIRKKPVRAWHVQRVEFDLGDD